MLLTRAVTRTILFRAKQKRADTDQSFLFALILPLRRSIVPFSYKRYAELVKHRRYFEHCVCLPLLFVFCCDRFIKENFHLGSVSYSKYHCFVLLSIIVLTLCFVFFCLSFSFVLYV